ncbi:MAG: sensor histidine kinase [Calditrichae bacterium]|nr:sensor histidine kinase [Calditrichia bacterium]
MKTYTKNQYHWWLIIWIIVIVISIMHYTTPTMKWQYHLILMQSYFIPILLAAFQFGIRGGLGTAIGVSILYFPHIMLQWGGLVEANLMRFLQILLFNVIGYLTGLKAQQERIEKQRYQETAEQLKKSLHELQQKTSKIEEMEDQLRLADRLAVIGELTASLAHEVRNPLGSIRGVVDILKDESPESVKMKEFLDILVQETDRLNQVVENYLGYARQPKKEKISFDVRDIIQNSEMLLMSRARKVNISINTLLCDSPLYLVSYPGQLQQIIINLTLNGIQASQQGDKISIRADKITADTVQKSNWVGEGILIQVIDRGAGIEKSDIDNIFKPFYTTNRDGTGLGLAIVKTISDQNKWQLDLQSQTGKGTTFSIFIPQKVS